MAARKRRPGGGRKPLHPAKRRVTTTFRMDPALHAALERECRRNNRTLNREIETRLQKSFEEPGDYAFGESPDKDFAKVIVELAHMIRVWTGNSWRDDRFSFDEFRAAVQFVLVRLMPKGKRKVPELLKKTATPSFVAIIKKIGAFGELLGAAVFARFGNPAGIGWWEAEPDDLKYQWMQKGLGLKEEGR